MQASNRFSIDGELVLRAAGLAPATGSVATDSITADTVAAYWAPIDRAEPLEFAVIVDIESIETDDDQTYAFTFQSSSVSNFGSSQDYATQNADADTTRLVFGVAREQISPGANFFRMALVTGGNTEDAVVTFTAAAFTGLEITVNDGNDSETYTFDDGLGGTLDPGADENDSATALADAINNSSTIDCTATVDGAEVTITSNFLQAGDPLGTASVSAENDDDPATATITSFAQTGASIAFNAYIAPFTGR